MKLEEVAYLFYKYLKLKLIDIYEKLRFMDTNYRIFLNDCVIKLALKNLENTNLWFFC